MSFPTSDDMPVSSCRSGRVILPAVCSARSAENATRAHSTVERQPVEVFDLDGDLACFLVTSGEVETRLRERGCMGVMGAEFDLRMRLLAVGLTRSSSPAGSLGMGCKGALAASPRDFNVALMICVASIAFSFADSSDLTSPAAFLASAALDVVPFRLVLVARVGLVAFESVIFVVEGSSSFGIRRSLRRTVVAGVHVAMDATAILTCSAWSCREAM